MFRGLQLLFICSTAVTVVVGRVVYIAFSISIICVYCDLTDAPSIPSKPQVVDSDNDFIFVNWSRPTSDGGTAILGYNIERQDALSNRWVKLNTQLLTVTSC